MGFKNWKLRTKVFVPALLMMAILSVGLSALIYRQQRTTAIAEARQTAETIAVQIAADRSVYTKNVVSKLNAEHADLAFADMKSLSTPKMLPLPASFVHLTSNIVNSKGYHTADLLSLWNINPEKKPQTDDVRRALEELVRNPDQAQEIVIDRGKDARFISVTADVASAQGCVDCHNKMAESPKHDFRLGDVMGGLVISVPLARPLAEASNNAVMLALGLIGVFAVVLLVVSWIQWAFISKPLLRLEHAADQISLGEIETPISVDSKDEVGDLAKAFERMRVSLARAMETLDRQ